MRARADSKAEFKSAGDMAALSGAAGFSWEGMVEGADIGGRWNESSRPGLARPEAAQETVEEYANLESVQRVHVQPAAGGVKVGPPEHRLEKEEAGKYHPHCSSDR